MSDEIENSKGLAVFGNRGVRPRPTNLVRRGLDHITNRSELTRGFQCLEMQEGVLVEALSVVIRREAVEDRFPGGWQGFLRQIPNRTLCCDRDLARVGFMNPADVGAYVSTLEAGGLVFQKDDQAVDFVVVDQFRGPTLPASWLKYGRIETGGMKINACWLAERVPAEIA